MQQVLKMQQISLLPKYINFFDIVHSVRYNTLFVIKTQHLHIQIVHKNIQPSFLFQHVFAAHRHLRKQHIKHV
jgi:hypothetical protein